MSSLPDLIQQQPRPDPAHKHTDGGHKQMGGALGDMGGDFVKTHSRSGSGASQGSVHGSSLHSSPKHCASPIPSSIADLQDPSKFTIGQGEQRKRVTRANFERRGSGLEGQDPGDPLSSLDPLWSIKSKDGK